MLRAIALASLCAVAVSCDSPTSPRRSLPLRVTVDSAGLTLTNENTGKVFYLVIDQNLLALANMASPACGCYPQIDGHASIRIHSFEIGGDTTAHPRTIRVVDWRSARSDGTMLDAHDQDATVP